MDFTEIGKTVAMYLGSAIGTALIVALFSVAKTLIVTLKDNRLRDAALAVVIEVEKQSSGMWDGDRKHEEALDKLNAMGFGWAASWLDKAIDVAVAEINDHLAKIAAKSAPDPVEGFLREPVTNIAKPIGGA